MILAGDVGGTKVHLALYNFESGKLKPVRDQKYPADDHASLDEVVLKFLGEDTGGDPANPEPTTASSPPASAAPAPCATAAFSSPTCPGRSMSAISPNRSTSSTSS